MRFRTLAIAAALSAGFAPFKGAERPTVTPNRAPRAHRDITWRAPAAALASLPSSDRWSTLWDRDTDVPSRLWGPAIAAPGTSADPAAAEAFARGQLAQHLALVAPGAQLSDFVLLANTVDRKGLRTVAFAQNYNGLRVVGANVAFTFGNDQLSMISSSAMPNVQARMPSGKLAPDTIAASARNWLATEGYKIDIKAHGDRVLMPVVHERGNRARVDIDYRVAEVVEVQEHEGAGRWDVWIDADSAAPIARQTRIHYATGTVLYDVPDRWPGSTRSGKPAPKVTLSVNGSSQTTDAAGLVTWATTSAATVAPSLSGPLVRVFNDAGAVATGSLSLSPGGSVTWTKATDEYSDSQLIAFVSASTAKQFVRDRLNPSLSWLNQQIQVSVNENDICNAYSTGDDIHFYKAGSAGGYNCENTGRLTDVVYHEFGHSVHYNSIIPGDGDFEDALSEGLSDVLAASITGDPGMGRGFFKTNNPLRNLDPATSNKRWPEDTDGEPHDDGEIIGQTLWDLRKALIAEYGDTQGVNKFLEIYYGIIQHAADIPTSYTAALLTDDDDNNLSNGTPNQCLIDAAFALHGLANPASSLTVAQTREGFSAGIAVAAGTTAAGCPSPSVTAGTLTWSVEGSSEGGTLPLAASSDGTKWLATIPTQPDGLVVRYSVSVTLSDGMSATFPQNPADPTYQFYVGAVKKLWCADFESGLGDWGVSGLDWEAGMPLGVAGDPSTAHGGSNVLGLDLGSDGFYRNGASQFVESPAIDLEGNKNIRLQYYRWLTVEDALYDQATISVNNSTVWTNATASGDGVAHTDKEWRFHDVDLRQYIDQGAIKLQFKLSSDEGLAFGGWNIDDVCVVEMLPPGSCDPESDPTCETPGDDGGCCSAGSKPTSGIVLSLLTLGFLFMRRRRR